MAKQELRIPNYSGRGTFDFILQQVELCFYEISLLIGDLSATDIYSKDYYTKALDLFRARPTIDLKQLAISDIAYNIVFFGVSTGDVNILERLFNKYYNSVLIEAILFVITKKPHVDSGRFESWTNFKTNYFRKVADTLTDRVGFRF